MPSTLLLHASPIQNGHRDAIKHQVVELAGADGVRLGCHLRILDAKAHERAGWWDVGQLHKRNSGLSASLRR